MHSTYLSQLPHQLYSRSASSLSASQVTSLSTSTAAANSWRLQSDPQASSPSASLPASAEATTSGSRSAAQAGLASSARQHVSRYQDGVRVQSNLLQGATFTALLELVIGISHMQNSLRRMRHLMESQQQHLQQMLMHHHVTEAKLSQAQHLSVVKFETDTVLRQPDRVRAGSAALAVKLEEQHPESSQPGTANGHSAGLKSEDAEMGNGSTETRGRQASASKQRRPPQRLAWHVVSSGVVQVVHVGLDHAVLEVRPPPPWSHAASSVQPKAEDKANLSDNPFMDVQQPSVRSDHLIQHKPHNKLHTADSQDTFPVPFLRIHMQWKLTTGHLLDQNTQPEPQASTFSTSTALQAAPQDQPVSKEHPPSQGQPPFQRLPHLQELPQLPERLPPQHPHSGVDKAKHESSAAKSEGQGIPVGVLKGIPNLRCCMQSEPELPWQVLKSFQDMSGM